MSAVSSDPHTLTIAFAGNPNVGKTALINAVSQSRLKVGNWPGVTVEKKEARYVQGQHQFHLIDLPGTYSLVPHSIEERVCRDYLNETPPDLLINVVDASNLEKSLSLTLELLEQRIPMVLLLNMWDEFEIREERLDVERLAATLGIPVLATSAVTGQGIEDLKKLLAEQTQRLTPLPVLPDIPEDTSQRYALIQRWAHAVMTRPDQMKPSMTERVDQVLLNEWSGIPIFLALLFLVFKLTFDVSTPFVDWIDGFFNGFLGRWAELALGALSVPDIVISLVKDGMIGGVGLVLTFVPILMFLYLFLALLEESGYMARAAFLMDRFMHRFGLHGKAFVPLLVGFGCNVPGVYATRALDSETDRKITVAVMSFMSCGAKLPIYALFTAVFFQRYQAFVILAMYVLGVSVAIFWAVLLRKTRFKGEIPVFMMELPPYRFPQWKALWGSIWSKTRSFIRQAGTVIAVSMVLLWALVNLPYGNPPEKTVLGYSARAAAPLFLPQGFGQRWEPVAAILPGFMAKEMVVGTLGVVLSVQQEEASTEKPAFWSELGAQLVGLKDAAVAAVATVFSGLTPAPLAMDDSANTSSLTAAVRNTFTPLTAFAYMVFNLFLISCISVVGAMTAEFGGRYFGFVFCITSGTAYVLSALVYQVGLVLGFQ